MEPALHVEMAAPSFRGGQCLDALGQRVEELGAVGRAHGSAPGSSGADPPERGGLPPGARCGPFSSLRASGRRSDSEGRSLDPTGEPYAGAVTETRATRRNVSSWLATTPPGPRSRRRSRPSGLALQGGCPTIGPGTPASKRAAVLQTHLGDVAQLARAPALQAGGHGFESRHLHRCRIYNVFPGRWVFLASGRYSRQRSMFEPPWPGRTSKPGVLSA